MDKDLEIRSLKLENELLRKRVEDLKELYENIQHAFIVLREECEERGIDINGQEGNDADE